MPISLDDKSEEESGSCLYDTYRIFLDPRAGTC